MRVLIACEFSGAVRSQFRAMGHDAWSCDLLPSLDNSPHHFECDVFAVLNDYWDMLIAHPPCTHISNMSNCRINEPGRRELRKDGMEFFLAFTQTKIPRVCIENPRGLPEREYRKADQIVQPYQFGDPFSKATCFWLTGLSALKPTKLVEPDRKWDGKRYRTFVDRLPSSSPRRSITFPGIASAMADQWGTVNAAVAAIPKTPTKKSE